MYYLVANNNITCNQPLTIQQIESNGYTTRLRGGVLVVFKDGLVVAKGYDSLIEAALVAA